MANWGRRSHQRAQTAPWIESVPLSRRRWYATVGGLGRDRRQSNQYWSIPGSNAQRVENVSDEWRSAKGKRQRWRKIAVRKQLSGWVQDIAPRHSSFLRRKVASATSSSRHNRPSGLTRLDGKWIAFESTQDGPVQIWVRNVSSSTARRLTGGNCNNSAPAWDLDSKSLLFASDCDRAFGLPALYRAPIPSQ
jgi:Tol biopolymer transport system component